MLTEKPSSDMASICDKELARPPPIVENTIHHWNKKDKYKWTIVLFFGNMLVYSVRVSMSISVAAIGIEMGWNKQISGMALSAFFFGYLLTNVLGGYIADRVGGEIVIFYTGFGWGSLTLLLPFVARFQYTGTLGVLLIRFLTGVCQGAFYPSIASILTKHVVIAERGFIISFTNSGSSIGTTLTGFVGSLIIEHFDWSMVFITIGSSSLIWIIILRYMISMNPHVDEYKDKYRNPKEPLPLRQMASNAPFWALLIGFFTNSYCFYNLLSWTPLYFHEAFPESKGWIFNVVPWIVCFVFANLSGYASNLLISNGYSVTFVRKLNGGIMYLGVTIFSLLLNSVETFKQALFLVSLDISMNGFSNCSIGINAQDLAPKHAGALHGLANSCGAIAGFLGVYVTGYILETTGQWSSVFVITALSAFIGFLTYVGFGSGDRIV